MARKPKQNPQPEPAAPAAPVFPPNPGDTIQ